MGLAALAASGVVLTLVPLVAWSGPEGDGGGRVVVLAAAWCLYHLLEYLGGVALWSWLGDLYPPRLRSRLIGGRERWLTLGRVVGIGASIAAAALWRQCLPSGPSWTPLAASASVGTLLMLASLGPLALVRSLAESPSATPRTPWRSLRQAFRDGRFRKLLGYSCWFGFANGVSGTAQGMYPKAIGVSYDLEQAYRLVMWAGQSAVAPACGREVERAGPRRVLVPAQLVVALGPLCYFFATAQSAWLIGAAYVLWIAYAPLNVALDTLKLDLADPKNNTPYLAAYYAASDVTNGLTMLLGGLLYDTLKVGDAPAMQVYATMFLAGWVCRTLAAGLAMRIEDGHTSRRNAD
jgi:Na+/melibiose symporter-like transporter